jgi:hypothetical protein
MTNSSLLFPLLSFKQGFLTCILAFAGLLQFNSLLAQRQLCVKAGSPSADFGKSLFIDSNGNLVFTGSGKGDVTFGDVTTKTQQNEFDKLILGASSPDGSVVFLKMFGGDGDVAGQDVVTDEQFIYAGGNFSTSIFIDNDTLSSAGEQDIFVVKTDAGGNPLWSIQAGGSNQDVLHAITYLPGQGLFLAGSFEGNISFGDTSLTSAGGKDIFIANYSSDGTFVGAIQAGGIGDDEALAIHAHPELGLIFSGTFSETGIFDWTILSTGGSMEDDALLSLDFSTEHGILAAGYYSELLNFNNTTYPHQGGKDILAIRYDTLGAVVGVYADGCDGDEWISSAKFTFNTLAVAGSYSQSCTLGNSDFVHYGETDVFQMRMELDWSGLDYKIYGGIFSENLERIAYHTNGNIYSIGSFSGNCVFSQSSMTGRQSDIFITSYQQNPIAPEDIEVTHFHTGNSGLSSNSISHVFVDRLNNLWISTLDSGIVKFDGENWQVYNSNNTPLPNSVNQVFSGPGDLIWVSTWGAGLFKFDGLVWQQFTTQNSSLQSDSINSVTGFSEGSLWIGTNDLGCIRFIEPDDFTPFNTSNSMMPSNIIEDMEHDSNGNFWIATKDGGVAQFVSGEIETWDTGNSNLTDNRIHGLFVDKADNTVFAATESGIFIRETQIWEALNLGTELEGIPFNAVSRNRAGIVSAGTKRKGGHIRTPIVQRSINTDNSLFDNQVVSIKGDTSARIFWLASPDNGLFRLEYSGLIANNESKKKEKMLLFPNPAGNTLNLRLDASMNSNAMATIIDARGIKHLQEQVTFSSGVCKINIESLASGIYFLHVLSDSKIVSFAFVKDE